MTDARRVHLDFDRARSIARLMMTVSLPRLPSLSFVRPSDVRQVILGLSRRSGLLPDGRARTPPTRSRFGGRRARGAVRTVDGAAGGAARAPPRRRRHHSALVAVGGGRQDVRVHASSRSRRAEPARLVQIRRLPRHAHPARFDGGLDDHHAPTRRRLARARFDPPFLLPLREVVHRDGQFGRGVRVDADDARLLVHAKLSLEGSPPIPDDAASTEREVRSGEVPSRAGVEGDALDGREVEGGAGEVREVEDVADAEIVRGGVLAGVPTPDPGAGRARGADVPQEDAARLTRAGVDAPKDGAVAVLDVRAGASRGSTARDPRGGG